MVANVDISASRYQQFLRYFIFLSLKILKISKQPARTGAMLVISKIILKF